MGEAVQPRASWCVRVRAFAPLVENGMLKTWTLGGKVVAAEIGKWVSTLKSLRT